MCVCVRGEAVEVVVFGIIVLVPNDGEQEALVTFVTIITITIWCKLERSK